MIIEIIVAMVTLMVAIVRVFPHDHPEALLAAEYKKASSTTARSRLLIACTTTFQPTTSSLFGLAQLFNVAIA